MYISATIENLTFTSTETVNTVKETGKLTMTLDSNPTVTITVEPKCDKIATLLFTFEDGLNLNPEVFCHRIAIVDNFVKIVGDTLGWVGIPTHKLQGRKYSPLGVFNEVFVDGDQMLIDYGLVTRKSNPIKPMITLRETVTVDHVRGRVLGGESNHRDTFYTSWSGKTQKDNVTLTVYSDAYNVVCEPRIEFYQPIRVGGIVFNDLPFVENNTFLTKELFNSYSMQKVSFSSRETHMSNVVGFDAYVFKTSRSIRIIAEEGLSLYEISAPEWAMLPEDSNGSLMYTSMYALSYGVELSKFALDKLGCVLAREIWSESGEDISNLVVYPETLIYRAGVPVKSDYEHKFVTPTSNETQSLISLTGDVHPVMYVGRVGAVIDRQGNTYVSVRCFSYATNHNVYVSAMRLNSVMDMPREARLEAMEKLPSGSYSYEGVDYDEYYIRFPESRWASRFSNTYGVPAFPAMYSTVYDSLPDNLKSMESANCIEEVCEYLYISGAFCRWSVRTV
jgi:hypothetical protein